MPAQAAANSVIVSAMRLIEVRHSDPHQKKERRDEGAARGDRDPPDIGQNGKPHITGQSLPQTRMPR